MCFLSGLVFRQDWAVEYYDMKDGFHVAIEGIDPKEAERLVPNENFNGIPIIFEGPSGCNYQQQGCSIRPGDLLQDSASGKKGLYSGSVGPSPQNLHGMTVAHSIETKNEAEEDVHLMNRRGACVDVFNTEQVIQRVVYENPGNLEQHGSESITADLRLIKFKEDVKSLNEIQGCGIFPERIYKPKLHQGDVNILTDSIIVIRNNHREFVLGKIESCSYTNKKEKLFQTITVVSCQETRPALTEEGDCGALAFLTPTGDSKSIFVVGLVIGLTSESAGNPRTILNNLGYVLRHPQLTQGPSAMDFYDHSEGIRN